MTKNLNEDVDKLNLEVKKYKDKINELDTSNKSLTYDRMLLC